MLLDDDDDDDEEGNVEEKRKKEEREEERKCRRRIPEDIDFDPFAWPLNIIIFPEFIRQDIIV